MRRAVFLLVILASLALGGCATSGGGGGTGGGGTSTTIVYSEMRFDPNRIDAKVGQTITIHLVNKGAQRHDFAFPALNMPGFRSIETALEPGESTTITVKFDQPGIHVFICTLPGHAVAGMTGAVFVTE